MAINTLSTVLSINASAFNSGLAAARGQMTSFAASNMSLNRNMMKLGATMTGWVGGLISAGAIISDTIKKNKQFEESLSQLRSLTGVTTSELSFFKDEAIKLGASTTQSASQVVDAFKLIGSQAPKLLKSKEALAEVTKAAITLAEAGNIELSDASKGITTAINQMGISGLESARIINVLAAASQAGAGDVAYLNSAMEKSASVGASFGLSLEDMIALIETLAPRISDAATAGTNLRNILLKLESAGNDRFRPSIVGITEALTNLNEANLTTKESAKLFGLENIAAAKALMDNIKEINSYRDAITGTATAFDQQRINTDNLSGSIKSLSSAWEGLQLAINEGNGALRTAVDLGTSFINGLRSILGERVGYETPFSVADNYDQIKQDIKAQSDAYIKAGLSKEEAEKKAYNYVMDLHDKELNDLKTKQLEKDKLYKKWQQSKGSGFRIESINKREYESVSDFSNQIKAKESAISSFREDYKSKTENKTENKTETETVQSNIANYTADQISEAKMLVGLDRIRLKGIEMEKSLKSNAKNVADEFNNTDNSQTINLLDERLDKERKLNRLINDRIELNKSVNETMAAGAGIESTLFGTDTISKGLQIITLYDTLGSSLRTLDNIKATSLANDQAITDGKVANDQKETASAMTVFSAQLMKWFAWAGPLAPVLAMGVSMAAMSGLGQVVSAIPKFETGGIVSGGSVSGDKVPALLNSGEMVLNNRQQAKLFNQLDRGTGSNSYMSGDSRVEFVIKGDYLKGILNKVNKKDLKV